MPRIVKVELELTDAEFAQTLLNLSAKPNSAIVSVDGQPIGGLLNTTAGAGVTTEDDDDNNGVAGEVNKFGVPHLPAVHSGSKKLNNDGTWKRLKGVTAEAMDAAEKAWIAQNQQQQPVTSVPVGTAPGLGIPGAQQQQPAAAAPGLGIPGATAPGLGIPGAQQQQPVSLGIPGMTIPEPQKLPDPTPEPVTIEQVMVAFQALQTKYPQITNEYVQGLYAVANTTGQQLETDESARARLLAEINKVLAM